MPQTSPTLEMNDSVSRVAALDIGSNSFHLVVARIVANDVQIIHRLKLRVQLASGLDKEGWLSGEAIDRGLDNLQYIVESLKDFDPDQVRVVATYTLRKARNANDFIKAARRVLPYPIEVISGIEEARLIYLGVAHTSHQQEGRRLVIDIGGGSTEVIVGEGMEPGMLHSLSIGCVTFTKRYFDKGKIKPKGFRKAMTHARQEIEAVNDRLIREGWQSCLGSSGTIRAICELAEELAGAPPGRVALSHLGVLMDRFIEAGQIDKLKFKTSLSDERRRVLPAGLAILTSLFEGLEIESLEYSPAALREGVIYDMEDRLQHVDVRERTAESLVARYVVDVDQAKRVQATTLALYDQLKDVWQVDSGETRALLGWAALLHEVGLHINTKGANRHSAYILQNVELPGFNREQQQLLSTLVRFQRKRIQKADLREFLTYAPPEVSKLILMLRLGVLLNFKRQDNVVPPFAIRAEGTELRLVLPDGWMDGRPIFRSNFEREDEQIRVLGFSLTVES